MPGAGHGDLGLVVEIEPTQDGEGYWVSYFNSIYEEPGQWRWYSFDERYDVEVVSEAR
jgi:hypothetical protein